MGHVGTMDSSKIFAAVETVIIKQYIVKENYHE